DFLGRIDLEGVVRLPARLRSRFWTLPPVVVRGGGVEFVRERNAGAGRGRESEAAERHGKRKRPAAALAPAAPRRWIHPVLSAPSRGHPRLACRPPRRCARPSR